MNETRDQLICCLQEHIAMKLVDNKKISVTNLVGVISQFKQFRDWLQNNFRHELRTNLLKFIQEDSHHFIYDFVTGTVSTNHRFEDNCGPDLTPIILKPKLFDDLEADQPNEDNLYVLELIVFICKQVINQSICVSNLMESIEQKCEKQFKCYKLMVKIKDKKCDSNIKEIDEKNLIHLATNVLKPFFVCDSSLNTLTVNLNKLGLDQLLECLTKTCLIVIKNCLIRHLYRFGRRYSYDLSDWFEKEYKIIVEFMANRSLTLDLIIGLYPEDFNLRLIDRKTRVVDLNPRHIGESRSHELELMYKYGTEIRGGVGVITRVTETSATIDSEIIFFISGEKYRPQFKVVIEMVEALGQKPSDLRTFVHSGDRLCFDVRSIITFQDSWPQHCLYDLWLVSRIYNVRHSASCYVHSIFDDWKSGKWNIGYTDSDSEDSDHSYGKHERHPNSE